MLTEALAHVVFLSSQGKRIKISQDNTDVETP